MSSKVISQYSAIVELWRKKRRKLLNPMLQVYVFIPKLSTFGIFDYPTYWFTITILYILFPTNLISMTPDL